MTMDTDTQATTPPRHARRPRRPVTPSPRRERRRQRSLPLADLIALAQQAAERGTSLTLRGAHERSTADLERVAMAGRGHVTFDLSA